FLLLSCGCSGELASPSPAETEACEDIGPPLYEPEAPGADFRPACYAGPEEPIVVPECRLTVFRKQDVASQRDGVLLVAGPPVARGEAVPPDLCARVKIGGEWATFRLLREDDRVEKDQVLAWIDDRLARDDLEMKKRKAAAARAELDAAGLTR